MTPRALILAAGFGTRLGDLSSERPKPLFPVADHALIRYAVALLAGHGVREIAVNLHHHGDLIVAELGDGRALGVDIVYSAEEPEILGTGGALAKLRDWLTQGGRESFFVVNGKILIDVDLAAVRAQHEAADAEATMVVREVADAARWGAIEVDDNQRVTAILDHPVSTSTIRGTHQCMFTGVHLVSPRLVDRLPRTAVSDSIRDAYLPALVAGARLLGHRLTGYFHEHSTPERYLEGNWNALDGTARLRFTPGPLSGIDPAAHVDSAAVIHQPVRIAAGATVGAGEIGPYVVVGGNAVVESGARLDHVVLWPSARIGGAHRHAIVTPQRVFAVAHREGEGEVHGT